MPNNHHLKDSGVIGQILLFFTASCFWALTRKEHEMRDDYRRGCNLEKVWGEKIMSI